MKESYEFLGLPETASAEEVEARYRELKAKYNEEKWQDGEAGMNAARKLEKLEAAYGDIMEEKKHGTEAQGNAFDEVAAAIRSGDIPKAQSLLDAFNERNAEWHYLQSVVFYKKSWMNESKKQLEIAMQMDPSNEKYKDAYEKLKGRAEYNEQTGGAERTDPDVSSPSDQMGGSMCANCASMCYTYLCINLIFSLCCGCR